ncbi:hypothetical protein JW879_09575 [candidate division WOR-3 bacterium]|nr:hypothetical protein [candidate division WOR-3 bacterium]
MAKVESYQVRVWGGPEGHSAQGRARIQLIDGNFAIGWIYFYDEGVSIPNDSKQMNQQYQKEQIHMHLPSSLLESVIDLLRNESPISLAYSTSANRGWLTTGSEEVGEGE